MRRIPLLSIQKSLQNLLIRKQAVILRIYAPLSQENQLFELRHIIAYGFIVDAHLVHINTTP